MQAKAVLFPTAQEARDLSPKGRSEPVLLPPRAAAQALAVSPRTLWGLTARGEIPCVRVGRLVRYRPEALLAWAAAQEQLSGPNSPGASKK